MIEIILDKGLVIDAYVRVSLIGIEILTIDARIVIASVDTYLRFAEAVNRLDIASDDGSQGLPELMEGMTEGGAKSKTKGALEGAKDKLGIGDDDDDDGDEKKPRSRSRKASSSSVVAALPQQREQGMSEVHVHGVVPAAERTEIAAAAVRRVDAPRRGGARERRRSGPAGGLRVLREHWRVLEEAGGDGDGAAGALRHGHGGRPRGRRRVPRPRHDELVAGLAELAGKVQLTVKGFFDEEALMRRVVESSPAVARLRERVRGLPEAATYYQRIELGQLVAAEVEQARERDTALVLERLEPLAVAASREPPATADSAVNAAFLVERERVDEFSARSAGSSASSRGACASATSGRCPPYSFAGDGANAGARHGPDHRADHTAARAGARHRLARREDSRAGRERVLRRARDPARSCWRSRPPARRARSTTTRPRRPRTSCSSA